MINKWRTEDDQEERHEKQSYRGILSCGDWPGRPITRGNQGSSQESRQLLRRKHDARILEGYIYARLNAESDSKWDLWADENQTKSKTNKQVATPKRDMSKRVNLLFNQSHNRALRQAVSLKLGHTRTLDTQTLKRDLALDNHCHQLSMFNFETTLEHLLPFLIVPIPIVYLLASTTQATALKAQVSGPIVTLAIIRPTVQTTLPWIRVLVTLALVLESKVLEPVDIIEINTMTLTLELELDLVLEEKQLVLV
jgi:hypothetical protein